MRHRSPASRRPSPCRALYLVPNRKGARGLHVPPGRTLHLIDIENLAGGSAASQPEISRALTAYCGLAPVRAGDHIVIGGGPTILPSAGVASTRGRLVLGRGRDGADRALLAELRDAEWIAAHYDRVIVGSGDGIFAGAIEVVRSHGISVGVVAQSNRIAWRLRRAAHFVYGFDCGTDVQEAA